MLSSKLSGFHTEVIDIVDHIAQLIEDRDGILRAESMSALDLVLKSLEDSLEALVACVAALRYRIGLKMNRGENYGQ